MSQGLFSLNRRVCQTGFASVILLATLSVSAAPTANTTDNAAPSSTPPAVAEQEGTATPTPAAPNTVNTLLAAQLQPSNKALSDANQELLSRNAQLQRQVNDLQTQANILIYESKGQLFLYGAFTVLISLLVGIFISWLVFVRRERW